MKEVAADSCLCPFVTNQSSPSHKGTLMAYADFLVTSEPLLFVLSINSHLRSRMVIKQGQ